MKRKLMGLAIVVMVAIATAAVMPRRASHEWPTAIARIATFTDTLVESGTIGAVRMHVYSAPMVGGQVKIVELAPEGSAVKPGDLLVRFDGGPLRQNLAREEAALRVAEAELARAREDARLEQLRASGEIDTARQQIGFAESDLVNQLEGRGRVEIAQAETDAAEAAREVLRARAAFEDTKPLLTEGFVTRMELDRTEQALKRAEELQRLSRERLTALTKYERPAAVNRARTAVQSAREDLSRTNESVAARLAQRQAALGAAQSRVAESQARIATLRDQLARMEIRAGGPGLVVYRDLFFGADKRKPQVGDEVFANQPLMALPESSQLVVETRIREMDLHRISASQRVTVGVDAYPDLRLPAAVTLVGALAHEDPSRAGTKFFPVTVTLTQTDARLRPGMTARVEIQVATLPDVTVVPVQAVFETNGEVFCYVDDGGRPQRRAIVVAGENNSMAVISRGISAGERVLLVDPFAARQ